jgi:hypothetical protein
MIASLEETRRKASLKLLKRIGLFRTKKSRFFFRQNGRWHITFYHLRG